LIERHDRRAFAVTCYASIAVADEYTRRFREASVHWRDISRLDDAQAAAMIRRDAIDIVVLVAGHTAGNRPLVAARRPAPVQVSLYDLTTTGLDTIDAWITDPYLHPADTAERFTEKLVRVPFLHLHEPPDPTPAVVPPPVLESGAITFGSCNNPAKLTSEVLDIWARILVETPGSRLLLKYQDRFSDLGLQRRVAAAFAARGVVRDRLVFGHGRLDRPRQLATLNRVDIALDPFPFNGSNTTFEALWMGVPVIALAGRRFLGRVSASMLHVLDLDDCIAATPAGYVETAKSWAASHRRLADLRERLRRRIAASPLCDPATYARNVENVYRELWRTWCRGSLNRPP
jgi:predicted O-linked N-acetylglucosamine transferase (SPINDLY family)